MITLTRALVRHVRAVLRKSIPRGQGRGLKPLLHLQAGPDGLQLSMQMPAVIASYHHPGALPADTLLLPAEALDDLAGKDASEVTLTGHKNGSVQARWLDGGVPQAKDYPAGPKVAALTLPEPPAQRTRLPPDFLHALAAAAQIVAPANTRYALQNLQLRGAQGQIIATDGKQLLVQGGFTFPFSDDLLIPALPVFGGTDVPKDAPVVLGRTPQHLCLAIGPWHFYLPLDLEGRYPDADKVIPDLTGKLTTCRLTPDDAAFLARTLPRLPGADADESPITVDLGRQVIVRAQAEDQGPPTEVLLTHSQVEGLPTRLVCNRHYLNRALQLGFATWLFPTGNRPIVCRELQRIYLFMPLPASSALAPSPQAVRLASDQGGDKIRRPALAAASPPAMVQTADPVVRAEPSRPPCRPSPPPANSGKEGTLVEDVQALQHLVQDACGRMSGLTASLRRRRQPARRLQASLAALQRLHP